MHIVKDYHSALKNSYWTQEFSKVWESRFLAVALSYQLLLSSRVPLTLKSCWCLENLRWLWSRKWGRCLSLTCLSCQWNEVLRGRREERLDSKVSIGPQPLIFLALLLLCPEVPRRKRIVALCLSVLRPMAKLHLSRLSLGIWAQKLLLQFLRDLVSSQVSVLL